MMSRTMDGTVKSRFSAQKPRGEEAVLAPQLRPERKNRASIGMTRPLFAAVVFLALVGGAATSLHAQVAPQRLVDSAKEPQNWRSEEHTSELQSHLNLVCRLLLEKKK